VIQRLVLRSVELMSKYVLKKKTKCDMKKEEKVSIEEDI
jgi:hypothetical protein